VKLNIVIPSSVLGGGIKMIFTYANELTERGHDVVVYIPKLFVWTNLDGGKLNIKTSLANSFKRGRKVPWYDVKFKIKLPLKIEDKYIRDADVVIASAWYTAQSVFDLSPSKGKKAYFVQDYEIWHQDKSVVDNSYKLNMERICTTNTLAMTLKTECNVDSQVVYNGIDDNEFIVGEKLLNHPRTFIMLGNFSDYKGGRNGLNILLRLKMEFGIRAIIFGIKKYDFVPPEIEYYIMPKRVKLIELIRQSDVLLFPTLQEAWGLTAIEAMANKTAVVGMNTGCLKEIGVNGDNCLLSEFDYEILYQNAVRLIKDDTLLKKIQDCGYETALNFRWKKSFEKMESILLELVKQ